VSVDYFAVGVMAFECMYGRVSIKCHQSLIIILATLYRKITQRDTRPYFVEANSN
jgi:hypothetical protein